MSALLDLGYTLVVGLLAVAGVVGVLLGTGDDTDGSAWTTWLLAAVAALFISALIWTMGVQPVL